MRKRTLHIHRYISVVLLMVFSIALTPFSIFHHHGDAVPQYVKKERSCTHKLHVTTHADTCLICAAHFEKNYTTSHFSYLTYQVNKPLLRNYDTVKGVYTELISQSLRGPPAA